MVAVLTENSIAAKFTYSNMCARRRWWLLCQRVCIYRLFSGVVTIVGHAFRYPLIFWTWPFKPCQKKKNCRWKCCGRVGNAMFNNSLGTTGHIHISTILKANPEWLRWVGAPLPNGLLFHCLLDCVAIISVSVAESPLHIYVYRNFFVHRKHVRRAHRISEPPKVALKWKWKT